MIAGMGILSMGILTLLGTAHAGSSRVDMVRVDSPVINSLLPPFNCALKWSIRSLSSFTKSIQAGRIGGPCRFMMTRTYRGDLEQIDENREGTNTSRFVVDIQAPKDLQSYINTIYFTQSSLGSGCSGAKLYRISEDSKEESSFYTSLRSAHDHVPKWEIGNVQQIMGGDHLLEVPSSCLMKPSTLVIQATYVYEAMASQVRLGEYKGDLTSYTEQCTFPLLPKPIASYDEFRNIVQSQPGSCLYAYEREYTWDVPARHVSVASDNKTIIAQLALYEPMLPDQKREMKDIKLGHLTGAECHKIVLTARKKFASGGQEEIPLKGWWEINEGYLVASIPQAQGDTTYDFRFVLPKGCNVTNPVVKFSVEDFNKGDWEGPYGSDILDPSRAIPDESEADLGAGGSPRGIPVGRDTITPAHPMPLPTDVEVFSKRPMRFSVHTRVTQKITFETEEEVGGFVDDTEEDAAYHHELFGKSPDTVLLDEDESWDVESEFESDHELFEDNPDRDFFDEGKTSDVESKAEFSHELFEDSPDRELLNEGQSPDAEAETEYDRELFEELDDREPLDEDEASKVKSKVGGHRIKRMADDDAWMADSWSSRDVIRFAQSAGPEDPYSVDIQYKGRLPVATTPEGITFTVIVPPQQLSSMEVRTTRLDFSISGLSDKCTLDDAILSCKAQQGNPDGPPIPDTYAHSDVLKMNLEASPTGRGTVLIAALGAARNLDRTCGSITFTLNEACSPSSSDIPITLVVTDEMEME